MVIYPIPVEVTQARIQLVVDQNAKAPPNTINQDLQAVYRDIGSRIGYIEEPREVTASFAAAGAVLLVAGGALSLIWLNRFP